MVIGGCYLKIRFPHTNVTFLGFHTIGGETAMEEYEICMGANLTCMNDHLNRMGECISLYLSFYRDTLNLYTFIYCIA